MTRSPLGALLDVPEAADYLSLSEGQLRRHIAARRVRVLRAGRKVQMYERWLEEFRDQFTCAPDGDARGRIAEDEQASVVPVGLREVMPAKRQIRVR